MRSFSWTSPWLGRFRGSYVYVPCTVMTFLHIRKVFLHIRKVSLIVYSLVLPEQDTRGWVAQQWLCMRRQQTFTTSSNYYFLFLSQLKNLVRLLLLNCTHHVSRIRICCILRCLADHFLTSIVQARPSSHPSVSMKHIRTSRHRRRQLSRCCLRFGM